MKKIGILSWDNVFATLVVIAVLKFFPIVFTIDFLDPIQNAIEDFRAADVVFSRLRDRDKVPKDTNVVLVNLGFLDRAGIAAELEIVNEYEPLAVGIDSFFRRPKDAKGDSALARALRKTKNLVLVEELKQTDEDPEFDAVLRSSPIFAKYADFGFANLISNDQDEFRTIRTFSPVQTANGKKETFFAVKMAEFLDSSATEKFLERRNEVEIINFKRNVYDGKYEVFDWRDVLSRDPRLKKIKGKIVLFGFLGPDVSTMAFEDSFFTPLNKNYMGKAHPDMYGVVIHANVISMILEKDYIEALPYWAIVVITIILIYANVASFYYIEKNYENLYEAANLFIVMGELTFIFLMMVYSLYWFDFEFGFREATLYGVLFSPAGFEIYHGSLKPLYGRLADKISAKRRAKAAKAVEDAFGDENDKETREK